MGACSSCLGNDRDRDTSDEDEQSRLLFEDTQTNHYGNFGDHNEGTMQADPQEVQRETEALQQVVMQTSNNLVDIFAMVPQNDLQPAGIVAAYPVQDVRLLRSQDVLVNGVLADKSTHLLPEDTTINSEGWISDEEGDQEARTPQPIKSDGVGPLLVGFADAEHSMR